MFGSGMVAPLVAEAAPLSASGSVRQAAATSRAPAGPFASQPTSSTPAFGGQRVDMPSQRPPLAAYQRQKATRMHVVPAVRIGTDDSAPSEPAAEGRSTASLRTASVTLGAANATGMNPWWTFEQGSIPGVGQFMVNIASSKNLLVESEDFIVPHRWADLVFRRTYNSLSKHDYTGSDGSLPSSFGNGWTNTLDAHLAVNSGQSGWFGISVFDADGARYDYLPADGTGANFIPPPGQHATLTTDTGHCNYYWTKPGGLSYQFKTPVTDRTKPCAVTARFLATAGRLITVYGRNQHAQLGLGYSWDGGVSSSSSALNSIAITVDGVQAASTLTFANTGSSCSPVKTFRLLSSITRPDGSAIYYKYDCSANLVEVDAPSNQAIGAVCLSDGTNCRKERYAYNGTGFMTAASGPLWSASLTDPNNLASGTNGGYVVFNPVGTTNAVASVQYAGVMNYTVSADGYSTSAFNSTGNTGVITYDTRYFDGGTLTTNYHDTDGHHTTYNYDAKDRMTSEVSYPDTGSLTRTRGWDDATNNLIYLTDRSGNRTDYAYDVYGNAIAVAQPLVAATVNNQVVNIRPTRLFAYDTHNNVIASCDATWSAKHSANWDGVSTPQSCPVTAGSPGSPGPQINAYSDQTGGYEPFGELTDVTSQLGYHRHYTYSGGAEGGTSGNAGADFGSVTTITGDAVPQQLNAPTVTPTESYVYDASGNTICRNDGLGWAISVYDSLGRKTK
ncbi:MAG TPA: DUF6531 domain-containing protein, partial [Xanthomonadales bacterium]|nr:DUF6531 domain-containing protein [Xanthomonadales bacterium]